MCWRYRLLSVAALGLVAGCAAPAPGVTGDKAADLPLYTIHHLVVVEGGSPSGPDDLTGLLAALDGAYADPETMVADNEVAGAQAALTNGNAALRLVHSVERFSPVGTRVQQVQRLGVITEAATAANDASFAAPRTAHVLRVVLERASVPVRSVNPWVLLLGSLVIPSDTADDDWCPDGPTLEACGFEPDDSLPWLAPGAESLPIDTPYWAGPESHASLGALTENLNRQVPYDYAIGVGPTGIDWVAQAGEEPPSRQAYEFSGQIVHLVGKTYAIFRTPDGNKILVDAKDVLDAAGALAADQRNTVGSTTGIEVISRSDAEELKSAGFVAREQMFFSRFPREKLIPEWDRLIAAGFMVPPESRMVNGKPTEYAASIGPWDMSLLDESELVAELYRELQAFGETFNRRFPEHAVDVRTMELNINRFHPGHTGLPIHIDDARFTDDLQVLQYTRPELHDYIGKRSFTITAYARVGSDEGGGLRVKVQGRDPVEIPTANGSGAFFFAHTPHEVMPMTDPEAVRYSFQAFFHARDPEAPKPSVRLFQRLQEEQP
jgi:hypothetical protein